MTPPHDPGPPPTAGQRAAIVAVSLAALALVGFFMWVSWIQVGPGEMLRSVGGDWGEGRLRMGQDESVPVGFVSYSRRHFIQIKTHNSSTRLRNRSDGPIRCPPAGSAPISAKV